MNRSSRAPPQRKLFRTPSPEAAESEDDEDAQIAAALARTSLSDRSPSAQPPQAYTPQTQSTPSGLEVIPAGIPLSLMKALAPQHPPSAQDEYDEAEGNLCLFDEFKGEFRTVVANADIRIWDAARKGSSCRCPSTDLSLQYASLTGSLNALRLAYHHCARGRRRIGHGSTTASRVVPECSLFRRGS